MAGFEVPGVDELTEIGHGGTAVVYRGVQRRFRRPVAVKVLDLQFRRDEDRLRFERECESVGALSGHPNIVTVFDAGVLQDDHPYLVMELLHRSLADRLEQDGRMPWSEAVTITLRLADALSTAHAAGVLHRDVKPENVMLTEADVPKLSDFGLARISGGFATVTQTVRASLTHASPELIEGRDVSELTDVYSLASTLHQLVTGRPPFVRSEDDSLVTVLGRILREPPEDLGELVPGAVNDVVLRAMSKAPADRPPTMRAFAAELADAAAPATTALPPSEMVTAPIPPDAIAAATELPPPATPSHHRRHRMLATVVAVIALGGAAAALWPDDVQPGRTGAADSTSGDTTGRDTIAARGGATDTDVADNTATDVSTTSTTSTTSTDPGATLAPEVIAPTTTRATTPPNRAPVLSVADQTSDEQSNPFLTLAGTDADGDALSYTVTGLPPGLSASGAQISGAISYNALSLTTNKSSIQSQRYTVTVKVSDGKSSSTTTFGWTIRDTYTTLPNFVAGERPCGSDIRCLITLDGPWRKACGGATEDLWRQSVAPGSVVRWGVSVKIWFGLGAQDPTGCEDVAQGW